MPFLWLSLKATKITTQRPLLVKHPGKQYNLLKPWSTVSWRSTLAELSVLVRLSVLVGKSILVRLSVLAGLTLSFQGQAQEHPKTKVSVDAERIISIGGGITEIVFALGKGRSVVATDTTSYFPEAAERLPKVGYQRQLNAEGILSFNPTLVLTTKAAGPEAVLKQIQAAGIRVESIPDHYDEEGLKQRIIRIGQWLKEPKKAAILAEDANRAFRAIETQKKSLTGEPIKVLFIMQHRGGAPLVAGHATHVDTLIRLSGALNVAEKLKGFRTLSPEALLVLNPDVILTTHQTLEVVGGSQALWRTPGLNRTTAGQEERLVSMDALLLMGFSIRSPLATRKLLNAWISFAEP